METYRGGSTSVARIAMLLPELTAGGCERSTLALAGSFLARGFAVDIAVFRAGGPMASEVPPGVRIVPLAASPGWAARLEAFMADPGGIRELLRPVLLARKVPGAYRRLPALVRYLRTERPAALIGAFPFENLLAIAARRLAGTDTCIIVTERNTSTRSTRESTKWKRRYLPALLRRQYMMADAIVAVSDGVADRVAALTGLPRERITTIYSPAVGRETLTKAVEPVTHPWFSNDGPPVVLGVGRLVPQKDFPTLIRAFAQVRAERPARLVIVGPGKEDRRDELLALARRLGCGDDVDLPGLSHNPFAYMAQAAVFVLSSRWEGFGRVVAEALACGCPVVSTDCPSGPAEILAGGRYGRLVPVGDHKAMAGAILDTLAQRPDPAPLIARGAEFSVERAAARYEALLFDRAVPTRDPGAAAALPG